MIGNRKNVVRVEVRSAHVFRANIRLEIGLGLVSGVNVGAEGKPCREIMRKRRSDVSAFVVRPHIEKLVKASDRRQMKFGRLNGPVIGEENVLSGENRALADGARIRVA